MRMNARDFLSSAESKTKKKMRKGSAHVVQGLMVDKDMKKFKDAPNEEL